MNIPDHSLGKKNTQTSYPPRIPLFYTLTKIHKPIPVGRPIISGCDGPTERISLFVDTLLQPIAQTQPSCIKDTTDFINFIEKNRDRPRYYSSIHGRYKLVHKYTSRRRHKHSMQSKPSQENGNATLMTFSPFGIATEQT